MTLTTVAAVSSPASAGHTVGLYADGHVELNGLLWHDNVTDTVQDGGMVLACGQYWGDSRFTDCAIPDNYLLHLPLVLRSAP